MYVWDDKKKQYVSDTPASRIPVKDSAELFDSNNVEGALAELAGERDAQGITLQDHTGKIENLTEAVDWLKVNGGGGGGTGGGGTVMPTITTTDELSQVVPKGQEIVLNVFFSSPNLGQGSLVLLVNNKEVNSFTIKQGSNSINIGALKDLRNKIVIYAKDRANLVSNEITYNIINGGVSLTLDFDYYADYPADKNVLMRYNIDTDQEDVQLEVTVDNNKSSVACKNGYNEYYFKNLTVGIHAVTVRAVSGQFISETYSFNLVIINSDSLYISSTFGENPKCTLGVPVVIDYRISYKDDTAVTLVLTLDGKVNKTLTSKRGSYAWTLNDMTLGSHSYKIDCTLGKDTVSLEGTFEVEAGDYTPLQINTDGLRYQMGCANRTNQDDDKEEFIYDNGISQITTRLKGFNFETNGWIDGALVCNGGAYAVIDYTCMEDNAPYSLTVEVDFKATDIGLPDARVLECRDANTKKGFHVALNEAKLNSMAQEARVYITPEERTTVSLQIDRQSKFAKIYVNGIITSAFYLTDSGSGTSTVLENFAHKGKIYVGCDKDLGNIGNCEIYDIRVYERRVSSDEIVKNVIAQEKNLRKQEDLYNFCFDNNTLSTMRLYSDEVENKVSNMTQNNKITMRAVYRSTNTEKYGQPFELKYCKVYWQGTSSLDYIRKNYNLELYDDDLKEFYYSPYPNSVQEYLFCLKCDYMESSHARNVGIGNLVNKYWYISKNPAQLKDDMVQNAVQGFPMLLYINDEFMGVYNFNTDRYSSASFGYTGDKCLAYEVSANSDTTAGAFITYDKTKHEGNEIDYYKTDFMCLYPPTRRAGNDTMDEIKALVTFVDKSSDEEFVTNINNNLYFNKEYLLRYFIYCLVMGAVDSLGKNMKLATWDNGKTWYPQIYDCDTTMGLDNSGMLFYDTNIKIQAGVYNTSSSRLWSRLMELMWADIQAEYTKMRNTTLTLENLYECIITNQMDCIPATYYNSDCETKYLQFKASYLDALHGQGKQQVTEWLRARLLYMDTYMEYWTTTSDFVSLRSAKEGTVYIDLEMFDNMFVQIKWRNTGEASDNTAIQIQEVKKGEVMRFSFESKAKTDQEIRVFGGKYVKSLGDLSNLSPVRVNITSATRLTELVCHSNTLKTVELSTCTNLQRVDLKDCTILGSSDQSTKLLNVSGCTNLKYVNVQNTQLQGVNLNAQGSNIEEIWYPKNIQSVVVANCPHLKVIGLTNDNTCRELSVIGCPNLEAFGARTQNVGTGKYSGKPYGMLRGMQTITIDNSCLDMEVFQLPTTQNLNSLVLKNLPKLKEVQLGHNNVTGRNYTTNISTALTSKDDFILESVNCPLFKTFRLAYSATTTWYEYPNYDNTQDKIGDNQYGSFAVNKLNLLGTNIEYFYADICTHAKELLLPTTVKQIVMNKLYVHTNLYNNHKNYNGAVYSAKGSERLDYGDYVVCKLYNAYSLYSGNYIERIYNPNKVIPTETYEYNLLGFELEEFSISHMGSFHNGNTYNADFNPCYRNIKVSPKKYPVNFLNRDIENVEVDYSNYYGEPVRIYTNMADKKINYTGLLPNDYEDKVKNICHEPIGFIYNCQYELTTEDLYKYIPFVFSLATSMEGLMYNVACTYLDDTHTEENPLPLLYNDKITEVYINSSWCTLPFAQKPNQTFYGGYPLGTGTNWKYFSEIQMPKLVRGQYFICNSNFNNKTDFYISEDKAPKEGADILYQNNIIINRLILPKCTSLARGFSSTQYKKGYAKYIECSTDGCDFTCAFESYTKGKPIEIQIKTPITNLSYAFSGTVDVIPKIEDLSTCNNFNHWVANTSLDLDLGTINKNNFNGEGFFYNYLGTDDNIKNFDELPIGIINMSNMYNGAKNLNTKIYKPTENHVALANMDYAYANLPQDLRGTFNIPKNVTSIRGMVQGSFTSVEKTHPGNITINVLGSKLKSINYLFSHAYGLCGEIRINFTQKLESPLGWMHFYITEGDRGGGVKGKVYMNMENVTSLDKDNIQFSRWGAFPLWDNFNLSAITFDIDTQNGNDHGLYFSGYSPITDVVWVGTLKYNFTVPWQTTDTDKIDEFITHLGTVTGKKLRMQEAMYNVMSGTQKNNIINKGWTIITLV